MRIFFALSHNYFHILNPNLEFLQLLHFIFNQNNHFMFQLLKVGVVQYFHSYLLVFGFLRKILEQRTGSFSLVLERPFSPFPIQCRIFRLYLHHSKNHSTSPIQEKESLLTRSLYSYL